MSINLNNGIPEADLPVKNPSGAARIRYVDGDGKSYSSAMPDVTAAAALVQDAIDGVVASAEAEIGVIVNGMGYLPPVAFTSGLNVDSSRFTVTYDGVTYAPVADAVPFTTNGTFNPAQWRVIQGISAADLAAAGGAGLVGYMSPSAGSVLRDLGDFAGDFYSVKDAGAIGDGVTDDTEALRAAFSSGRSRVLIPPGTYIFEGDIDIPAGVSIIGSGRNSTILRQVSSGGIVFGPVSGESNYGMDTLNISGVRFEAGAEDCGTAIRMIYEGGSGFASPGPVFTDVEIVPSAPGTWWTRGVYGTNVRDGKFSRVDMGSNSVRGEMSVGFEFDGDSDPVELYFDNCYLYVMEHPYKIGGTYEGIYFNSCNCTSTVTGITYTPTSPQPVLHVADTYLNVVESAVYADILSYFKICDSYITSSGLVEGDFIGITIDRTTGDQIQAGEISDCTFVGGNTSGSDTEKGVLLKSAKKVSVRDCVFYSMDEAVIIAAGSGNRVFDNSYINCASNVSATHTRRVACEQPEVFLYAASSSPQTIPSGVATKVGYPTVGYDIDGYYESGISRFTPPAGFYSVSAAFIATTGVSVGDEVEISVRRNGVQVFATGLVAGKAGYAAVSICCDVFMNGSDYLEVFALINGSSGSKTIPGSPSFNYLTCKVIR